MTTTADAHQREIRRELGTLELLSLMVNTSIKTGTPRFFQAQCQIKS